MKKSCKKQRQRMMWRWETKIPCKMLPQNPSRVVTHHTQAKYQSTSAVSKCQHRLPNSFVAFSMILSRSIVVVIVVVYCKEFSAHYCRVHCQVFFHSYYLVQFLMRQLNARSFQTGNVWWVSCISDSLQNRAQIQVKDLSLSVCVLWHS